jgi:hypothetical protein
VLLASLALCPVGAPAAVLPQPFWTRCAADSEGDVQCSLPRGVASAPASAPAGIAGNVYVADSVNHRVDEFTAWGQFVRAWGWDVVQSGPGNSGTGFEICLASEGDVCKAGSTGAGAGQFGEIDSPQGLAVDSAGNIYTLDRGEPSNQRVQKFDPEGHFVAMWGKGVNNGTAANKEICTSAGPPEEVCGAGGEGSGPGQFGELAVVGDYIAIDTAGTSATTDDKVYVGDAGRIQRFDADGAFQAEIPLAGKTVKGLTVDPGGNLYASFCGGGCGVASPAAPNVEKLSGAGIELDTVEVANPQAVASGPSNNLYVIDGNANPTVRAFSPTGEEVFEEKTIFPFFPTYPFKPGLSASTGIDTGDACHTASDYDLYVTNAAEAPNGMVRAYGPPPDELAICPPPLVAPKIEDQGAVSVEADAAAVQARINPLFWEDTSYYVQYGTAACVEGEAAGWEAPCVSQKPILPALLGGGATDVGVETSRISLTGLTAGTTYSFRFVAQSRFDRNGVEVNNKGGPVFGAGGSEGLEGKAGSFTTATTLPGPEGGCPNQGLRSGAAAFLPDCRAYEMVSPIDKNGGDIRPSRGENAYIQVSPDGEHITYSAVPAFGNQPSNKIYNQYLAGRGAGGWSNRGINAPLGRQLENESIIYPKPEISAFSADLCSEWMADYNTTPLTVEGQPGYVNLYREDLCGEGDFEALTRTEPLSGLKLFYADRNSVQGFSEDLSQVFIVTRARLIDEAANTTNRQIYDYEPQSGTLHVVSVLPSGEADPGTSNGAVVGGGSAGIFGGNMEEAVSRDGERVYWSSRRDLGSEGEASIYLREHPGQGIVGGECSEAEVACTVAVSAGLATFWGASPDGRKALYSEGDLSDEAGVATLYRFDAETKTSTAVAGQVRGVLGASEDLSLIYFISTEALAGEPNGAGDEALAGEPNLYLEEEGGGVSFIGTLLGGAAGDVAGSGGGPGASERGPNATYRLGSFNPRFNAARVSVDGTQIVFQSRAALTHFDNTDSKIGKADLEVFIYEVGGDLHCISCNPSGVRPSGRELPQSFQYAQLSSATGVWAAAWIPGAEHPLHASNVLSANGKRVFFLSNTALVARDTNGAQDVYEWEAPGEGRCEEGSAVFHELNGGCVYLISSGESPFESEFWDASANGRDVFFTTESSLLPQDPGSIDLYDARENGGFAQPTQAAPCEGMACQNPAAAPNDPTPASSGYEAGTPQEKAQRCPSGKRQVRRHGKLRCVPKRHKATHHKGKRKSRPASHGRGAAR